MSTPPASVRALMWIWEGGRWEEISSSALWLCWCVDSGSGWQLTPLPYVLKPHLYLHLCLCFMLRICHLLASSCSPCFYSQVEMTTGATIHTTKGLLMEMSRRGGAQVGAARELASTTAGAL